MLLPIKSFSFFSQQQQLLLKSHFVFSCIFLFLLQKNIFYNTAEFYSVILLFVIFVQISKEQWRRHVLITFLWDFLVLTNLVFFDVINYLIVHVSIGFFFSRATRRRDFNQKLIISRPMLTLMTSHVEILSNILFLFNWNNW